MATDLSQFVAPGPPEGTPIRSGAGAPEGATDLSQFVADAPAEGRPTQLAPFVPDPDGRTLADEFVSGFSGGIDSLQMSMFGVAALTGRELGIDILEDFGLRGAERNLTEASQTPTSVAGFTDIENAGDFFKWAAGALGQGIPSLGEAGVPMNC